SAVTTANRARFGLSRARPRKAVATAPASRPPVMTWAGWRLVTAPRKTPPARASGAPARGMPPGSTIVDDPAAARPRGAFAGHSRPKALLIDRSSMLLTAGSAAVTAFGFVTPLTKAAD